MHADKIVRGAQVADVAVKQAIQFELVIILKAASALGIKIPASIRLRADKVIE